MYKRSAGVIMRGMTNASSDAPAYQQRKWLIFALIFVSHIYFLQIYPNFVATNELSRLLLDSAIVDDHTFQIDAAIHRYSDSEDKAKFGDHFYSDKAIGVSLISLPFFILMRLLESLLKTRFSATEAIAFLRIFVVTIPAILAMELFLRFWKKLRPGLPLAPEFLFLLLFGTIAFTYSMQLISHYLLGLLLFAAVYLLRNCKDEGIRSDATLLAGAAAGLALMMEYPAVFPVAMVCLYALWAIRNFKHVTLFAIPILISLALMLAYNYAIFATPFDVTYRHMVARHTAQHVQGVVGVSIPSPEAFYGLLLSRHHGLFFTSPFLLFSIPGLFLLWKSKMWRAEALLFFGIVFSLVFLYSGFSYWIGGWAFGPRYFAPIIPFLITAAYFFFTDESIRANPVLRIILITSGIVSILLITSGSITFPYPPDPIRDPNFFMAFPLIAHGGYGRNFGTWIGLQTIGPALLFYLLLLVIWIVASFPKKTTILAVPSGLLAIIFLITVFATSPQPDAREYYARGLVYYFLKKYDFCAADLEEALKHNPDPDLKGRIDRALVPLRQAIEQGR